MRDNRNRLQLCGVSTSKVHLAMKHTRTDLAKVGSEECQVFRDFPIQIDTDSQLHTWSPSITRFEYLQIFQTGSRITGSGVLMEQNRLPAGSHRMGLLRINSFGRGTRV